MEYRAPCLLAVTCREELRHKKAGVAGAAEEGGASTAVLNYTVGV